MEETLRSLGLEIFIDVENKIDDEAFLLLGDSELKELIPQIGPRIKIKNYISNFKQQQQQKANVHPSISELQDPVETLSSTPCESDIVFEYDNPLMPTIQEEADYSTHTVWFKNRRAKWRKQKREEQERLRKLQEERACGRAALAAAAALPVSHAHRPHPAPASSPHDRYSDNSDSDLEVA